MRFKKFFVLLIGGLMLMSILLAGCDTMNSNNNSDDKTHDSDSTLDNSGEELQDFVLKISAQNNYDINDEILIDITFENRSGADVEIAYYFLFYPESSTGVFF